MSIQAAGVKVKVDGTDIPATSVSVDSTQSTEPIKILGYSLSQGQAPTGPTETTVNIDYLIIDEDTINEIGKTIIDDPIEYSKKGSEVTVGGTIIPKAYLTSHSVTAEPQGLVTASASFISFEQDLDITIGKEDPDNTPDQKEFAHGQGSAIGDKESSGFTFEQSFEWEPILLMGAKGKTYEDEPVIFNGGTRTLSITEIGGGGKVEYCLADETAEASVQSICAAGQSVEYKIEGKLTNVNINAEVGGFAEGSVTVTQTL